jgi:hypothetical protein
MSLLSEAKDLSVYKKMLTVFCDFTDRYPGTGMSRVYKNLLNAGLKCVPKDKRAQEMLNYVLSDNVPKSIQDLINTNFTELPITIRPLYKVGNEKVVGFWNKDGKICGKTFDLLILDGESAGFWCDEKGEKIDLLDLSKEG